MQLVTVLARPLGAVHTFVFLLMLTETIFMSYTCINLHPNYKSNNGNLLRFLSHATFFFFFFFFTVWTKPFVDSACSLLRRIFLFGKKSEDEV